MAIDPQRRENLLDEATAYTRRVVWRVPHPVAWAEEARANDNEVLRDWLIPLRQHTHWELFVGLRNEGGWSVYFDEQPVMQFNKWGQLRRLYANHERYSAVQGRLTLLSRTARGGQVKLRPADLDARMHDRLLSTCSWFMRAAVDAWESPLSQCVGLVPAGDESWLAQFLPCLRRAAMDIEIADEPCA